MAKEKSKSNFRHIVRLANTDLPGDKNISVALTRVKGVNYMYANMICHFANIEKDKKTGKLSNDQIDKLDDVLRNPDNYEIPDWMKNRRKDYVTGEDKHLLGGDLTFVQNNDLKRMKKMKSYKGYRHAWGLPVRGQRTKSNFRRNKGKAVGVKRRKGAKSGRV